MNRFYLTRLLSVLLLALVIFLSACGERVVYVNVTPTPDPAAPAESGAQGDSTVPLPPTIDGAGEGIVEPGMEPTTGMEATPTVAGDPSLESSAPPAEVEVPEGEAVALDAMAGRVAFMGPYGENGGALQAFVSNVDGTGLMSVSEAQGEGYFPNISPDGSRVAFVANTAVDSEIFVSDVATGQATNITNAMGTDTQPVWSPDGSQIAFVTNRDGGDVDLWVMNADGGEPRRLTHTPGEDKLGGWNPDGTAIVYSNVSELGEAVWVMEIESGETTQLTERTDGGTDSSPVWSPNGDLIAFYSASPTAPAQIFTIAPDGSNRQQVTDGTGSALVPAWSPDGEWLLYTSVVGESRYDLTALNLATQESHIIPNVQGFATSWAAAEQPLADTGFTQGPAQAGVAVDPAVLEGAYSVGAPNAPVTVIAFSDYQCPFCKSWVDSTLPTVRQGIADGSVRLVFVDFPLSIHPQAPAAAQAARCAGELGGNDGYWAMHDALFASLDQWSGQSSPNPIFAQVATGIGLDGTALQQCIESGRYAAQVQAGIQEGTRLGITGTPTFFINGTRVVGAIPTQEFQQYLTAGGQ